MLSDKQRKSINRNHKIRSLHGLFGLAKYNISSRSGLRVIEGIISSELIKLKAKTIEQKHNEHREQLKGLLND